MKRFLRKISAFMFTFSAYGLWSVAYAGGYGYEYYGDPHSAGGIDLPYLLKLAIALGLVAAVIRIVVELSCMKTVGIANSAGKELDRRSFRLTGQRDIYLYTSVTRRKIENNNGGRGPGGHQGGPGYGGGHHPGGPHPGGGRHF